ncbi:MarR family winged helix-turn-helix transcriptional regulator [Adhaeribacter soli]|jgi:DNA-binding MarR family transcriptional regulator|uniref:MarR family transcriptional regulator n=1 Tax=Adhaeribacter soli TaxID=2607655 RepID=A0A5N1IXL5_9BACT|nr:MarR family transcriptional regulator [Adhaeribacter soli]KAA9332812.1 MarR family transcriptional regulator [Adhaeribacter soli]
MKAEMPQVKKENLITFVREMARVNLLLKAFMRQKFKEHNIDLTSEMMQVMMTLWRKDGINQQEIANITVKDKASLTYLIDNLARRELVQRTEDENDRRNKLITLTAKGWELKEMAAPWIDEMFELVGKDIASEIVTKGITLLETMATNLENQHANLAED